MFTVSTTVLSHQMAIHASVVFFVDHWTNHHSIKIKKKNRHSSSQSIQHQTYHHVRISTMERACNNFDYWITPIFTSQIAIRDCALSPPSLLTLKIVTGLKKNVPHHQLPSAGVVCDRISNDIIFLRYVCLPQNVKNSILPPPLITGEAAPAGSRNAFLIILIANIVVVVLVTIIITSIKFNRDGHQWFRSRSVVWYCCIPPQSPGPTRI